MKQCPLCKAIVANDRAVCGVCGTAFGTETSSLLKAAQPSLLRQAATTLRGSLTLLRRNPDMFLLTSLLALFWLGLVAVPAIILFSDARLSSGLTKLMSLIDIRALGNTAADGKCVLPPEQRAECLLQDAGGFLTFGAPSLFGVYFWAYALAVLAVLGVLYSLAFPLMVDQVVKTGRVRVGAALRDALKSLREGFAALALYSLVVFVTGWILLDYFFLLTGAVFGPIGVLFMSVFFALFWSYSTLRIWLVFPALAIDRASFSEAFGLSLDATRRNVRSSYLCVLVILALLYTTRGLVYTTLTLSTPALAGTVAVIALIVTGTIAGVIPSVYYYEVALRTDVGSMLQPRRLEALQEAR